MIFWIYRILWWFLLPWVLLFRLFKDFQSGKPFRFLIERLGFSSVARKHDIILHAVSLGEVRAMTPLLFEIIKEKPHCRILITTTTLTGRAQIKNTFDDKVSVAFLPHDIGYFTRRFLKKVDPSILMIMETEIWPNLLYFSQQLGIKTFIISACLSERSKKGYLYFPKTISKLLKSVKILTQTEGDKERFLSIGASHVKVMGNLKYYVSLPADFDNLVSSLRKKKERYILWTLASSHEGEEKLILEAFLSLKLSHPNLKLAIAPRHPERFKIVESMLMEYGIFFQKRSQVTFDEFQFTDYDVWLFDSIGELLYLYGVSDIITIGGSFIPIGGHNVIEPASLKKCITTGNFIDNIKDTVEIFENIDAIKILTSDTLIEEVELLVDNKDLRKLMAMDAFQCVIANQKALPIVMGEINQNIARI